jgi:predicted nucleotidyltransferase component of viral defense system
MFIDNLKQKYLQNKTQNLMVIRNVLKETIQLYILDFIYKSSWGETFIFKGGSCLRFCFSLPRLSEDLDFDIENYKAFSLGEFIIDLGNYFQKTLQYKNTTIKLAGNQRTIYLKFPILSDLGIKIKKSESNVVIIRLDLAPAIGKSYQTEVSIKTTPSLSLLIKRYSLPDLFAGKLSAILTRETMEGKIKKERFKGRDYFDLIWFMEKKVRPNWQYLKEVTSLSKQEALKTIEQKISKVSKKILKDDLVPFFHDQRFINQFIDNFQTLYKNYQGVLNE